MTPKPGYQLVYSTRHFAHLPKTVLAMDVEVKNIANQIASKYIEVMRVKRSVIDNTLKKVLGNTIDIRETRVHATYRLIVDAEQEVGVSIPEMCDSICNYLGEKISFFHQNHPSNFPLRVSRIMKAYKSISNNIKPKLIKKILYKK